MRARGTASLGKASASFLAGIPGGPSGSKRTRYCFRGELGSACLSVEQPISLQPQDTVS